MNDECRWKERLRFYEAGRLRAGRGRRRGGGGEGDGLPLLPAKSVGSVSE